MSESATAGIGDREQGSAWAPFVFGRRHGPPGPASFSPGAAVEGLQAALSYQCEHVADDTRHVVHMEGAEPGHIASPWPGEPGLDLPAAILFGAVVRQATTDPPAFR